MPSTSKAQAKFMAAAAHSKKFAKQADIPQSTAREWHAADKKRGKWKPVQDEIKHDPKSGRFMPSTTKGLEKVGGQLGSNPGGRYKHQDGSHFYIKESKSPDHAVNEVIAGKMYKLLGSPAVESHHIGVGGKPGTATRWKDPDKKFNINDPAHVAEARKHFATHAMLGNWDAIGTGADNQVFHDGVLTTVDAGGAMKYRAQGGLKNDEQWGDHVGEINSMRKNNFESGKVFGGMTPNDLHESAKRVAAVTPDQIRDLVQKHHPGPLSERSALADKLVARRASILSQTGHTGK